MSLSEIIAEQAQRVDRAPTDGQTRAGNYRKGHVRLHGIEVAIESPRGAYRRGVGADGKRWQSRLPHHYGYIKRTEGADGDHVDVYLGPHHKSPLVYVVDQHDPDRRRFDEHKCFVGFMSPKQVRHAYHSAFSDGRGPERLGALHELTVAQFKDWLRSGDTTKPFHRASGGRVPHLASGGIPDFDPSKPYSAVGSDDGAAAPAPVPDFDPSQPFTAVTGGSDHPAGVLTRSPDEGWFSGALKGAATGAIKGLSNSVGTVGNLGNFADYLLARGHSAITGRPVPEILAEYAKRRQDTGLANTLDPSQVLPSGEDVARPILNRTGEYEPSSEAGKIAQAGVEAATGMVGPGGGAAAEGATLSSALKPALAMAPANFGAGAVGQGVTDATGDPLAGMAASLVVPAAAKKTVDKASEIVSQFAKPFAEDLPLIGQRYAGTRDQMVRARLLNTAQDPAAMEHALFPGPRQPGGDEIVPGSVPTTGQLTGDAGLLQAERSAQTLDNTPFNQRAAEQNSARRAALEGAAPAGADVMQPSRFFQDQLDLVERGANEAVDRIRTGAQSLAQRLGPGETAEAQGAAIRGPIDAIYNEARKARQRLYEAVDPDGRIALPAASVRERANEVVNGIDAYDSPMKADEARIFGRVRSLPDVMPFRSLIALDKDIYAAMSAERRAAGDTPTWGRLSQLKSAVMGAINNAVDNQSAYESAAVRAGTLNPADTIQGRLEQLHGEYHGTIGKPAADLGEAAVGDAGAEAPGLFGVPAESGARAPGSGTVARAPGVPGEQSKTTGATTDLNNAEIYYPGGNLRARYEVVDLPDLITSHDMNFNARPDYPAALQPRERGSAPARDQVNNIAARLQPERLGVSAEANSGAPIVGPDNVVESGNGRTLAIAKAYQKGNPAYRQWLESQGFDTKGMEQPVLVARRTSPMSPEQRQYFAHSANSSAGLRMSAAEQASSDARLIGADALRGIEPGAVTSAENRPFVRAFAEKLPAAERGGMLDRDGNLSQGGARRIEAALAAKAFDDPAFVAQAFDAADSNVRNLAGALVDAAGPWARMREAARNGAIDASHDITPELMNVVRRVMRARAEGTPLADVMRQTDMFGSDVAPLVERLLFSEPDTGKLASRGRIASGLREYAQEAEKNLAGPRLFDDEVSPRDVFQTALKRAEADSVSAPAEPAQGPTFESGAGERSRPLEPNFDAAAAQRLRSAKKSHQDLAETFRNPTIKPVLRKQGSSGFLAPNSAIPSKAVVAGDRGYETARAFLKAAKNSPETVSAMQDKALQPLRKSLTSDATINPKALANWKRDYAGVLRALDEVSPGFSTAFDNAAKASDVLMRAGALAKEQIADAQKTAAAKFTKLSDPVEVENLVGRMLSSKTGPTDMQRLVADARGRPEVLDGLRKAGIDWLARKMSSTMEAGTTGEKQLSANAFAKMIRDNGRTLEMLYTPDQVATMRAMARDMERTARRLSTNVAGSPGTAKDVLPHIAQKLAENRHTSMFAAAIAGLYAGFHAGGLTGALTAAGLEGAAYLTSALRRAGINKVDDMFRDALLNPERARYYLAKIPPKVERPPQFTALSRSLRRELLMQPILIPPPPKDRERK